MSTGVYRLPDFLSLLPQNERDNSSPYLKEVETAFNAWVEQKLDPPYAEEIYKCDCPLFAALIFPLASCQHLRAIIDFTAAAFLLDDIIDCSPIVDIPAIPQFSIQTLLDETQKVEHPVVDMIRSELLPSIKAVVDTFHWPQLAASIVKMVMLTLREARERQVFLDKDTTPDLQSYLINRRVNVGAESSFVFARFTRGLYIPNSVLANPVVQEIENAVADMLTISNDIYSFKREYTSDGTLNNIMTVLRKDPQTSALDFQERLDCSGRLFKVALERFQACLQELPPFGQEMDQNLALYVDGLMDLVAGNLKWSRVVRRYNAFTNDEDRRNNTLRLTVDDVPV